MTYFDDLALLGNHIVTNESVIFVGTRQPNAKFSLYIIRMGRLQRDSYSSFNLAAASRNTTKATGACFRKSRRCEGAVQRARGIAVFEHFGPSKGIFE